MRAGGRAFEARRPKLWRSPIKGWTASVHGIEQVRLTNLHTSTSSQDFKNLVLKGKIIRWKRREKYNSNFFRHLYVVMLKYTIYLVCLH